MVRYLVDGAMRCGQRDLPEVLARMFARRCGRSAQGAAPKHLRALAAVAAHAALERTVEKVKEIESRWTHGVAGSCAGRPATLYDALVEAGNDRQLEAIVGTEAACRLGLETPEDDPELARLVGDVIGVFKSLISK
jgi:hypothetical protein